MLKYYLSVAALLAIGPFSYAQDYTPFQLENAEWIMFFPYAIIGPGDGGEVWKNNTRSDTLINGKIYKNLTETKVCFWLPDVMGDPSYHTVDDTEYLIGAIREEGRIVYFFDYEENEEIVLYDFNYGVGDTVWYTADDYTAILSEYTLPDGRIKYEVINSNADCYPCDLSWITQGSGSSYGLFGSYIGGYTRLKCFGTDGQIERGDCDVCEGYLSSTNDYELTEQYALYPNPASDELLVPSASSITQIQFFNITGKMILSTENIGNRIDIKHLTPGMYFYTIKTKDGVEITNNFLKQ